MHGGSRGFLEETLVEAFSTYAKRSTLETFVDESADQRRWQFSHVKLSICMIFSVRYRQTSIRRSTRSQHVFNVLGVLVRAFSTLPTFPTYFSTYRRLL